MNRSQDEQIIIETIQKADPNNITFRSVEALENSYQETKSFKNIKATDVSFKIVTQIDHSSIIKKATYYINQVQDILQNLVFEVKKNGEQTTFQHINKLLFFIQNLRKELDLEEDNRLKELFQSKIHPFTCQSDFCDYAHKKPRGYPGDFLMMEKIWNGRQNPKTHRYLGHTEMGKLINAFTLDIDICQANILRTKTFEKYISNPIYKRIASIGSGSVIEIDEMGKKGLIFDQEFHLFDQDEGALEFAQKKISQYTNKVFCYPGNIIKSILKISPSKFHCIYSSGLFDYFSENTSKQLAEKLWSSLAPNGEFYISNVHTDNPSKLWMEYIGDWYLINKTSTQMINILKNTEVNPYLSFDIDEHSSYQFISSQKMNYV